MLLCNTIYYFNWEFIDNIFASKFGFIRLWRDENCFMTNSRNSILAYTKYRINYLLQYVICYLWDNYFWQLF